MADWTLVVHWLWLGGTLVVPWLWLGGDMDFQGGYSVLEFVVFVFQKYDL